MALSGTSGRVGCLQRDDVGEDGAALGQDSRLQVALQLRSSLETGGHETFLAKRLLFRDGYLR